MNFGILSGINKIIGIIYITMPRTSLQIHYVLYDLNKYFRQYDGLENGFVHALKWRIHLFIWTVIIILNDKDN